MHVPASLYASVDRVFDVLDLPPLDRAVELLEDLFDWLDERVERFSAWLDEVLS